MKRLSKKHRESEAAHQKAVEKAMSEANDAIIEYNEALYNLPSPDEALAAFNQAIEEYNTWLGEVRADMECYYDERSERWQEGDAGDQYQTWIDAMEDLEEVDTEPEEPEEMEEAWMDVPELPGSPDEA